MYRENPFFIQLLSFVLAIGLHAALLFGHFNPKPSTIDDGIGTVDLAPGPPGDGSGELSEPPPPPPPPPPPGESLPEPPAEEEAMAREPQPDDIPEPDAVVKDDKKDERPRINVQYESSVYSTQKMSAEEAERAIRFLLERGRPGTGQVGSKPGRGGGGGGGRRYGDIVCKKCPYPAYPYEARKMRQSGTTVVRVLIGTDGGIQSIVVQESSGYTLLDQQAVRFLRKWEFEPKRLAGIPVNASVDIPLVWQLVDTPVPGEEPPQAAPTAGDATAPAPPPQ